MSIEQDRVNAQVEANRHRFLVEHHPEVLVLRDTPHDPVVTTPAPVGHVCRPACVCAACWLPFSSAPHPRRRDLATLWTMSPPAVECHRCGKAITSTEWPSHRTWHRLADTSKRRTDRG